MASTVWKGQLTFGLVSMPIRLTRAARPERVKLRQLYRPARGTETPPQMAPKILERGHPFPPSGARLEPAQYNAAKVVRAAEPPDPVPVTPVRRVFQPADEDVALGAADLVKGYEYDKDQYVVLEEQDLRQIAPQTSTEMQIVQFVRFAEIDPIYLETSYYLRPDHSAEKPYALLFEAMRQTEYAAIGQFTMHRRDHIVIIRTGKSGLIGHAMFYPDEVRSTEEFRTDTKQATAKELDLAKALIKALAQPFDPAQFKNAFRERLEQLIHSKIQSREITPVAPPTQARAVDIMDALKRSLAQAKSMALIPETRPRESERKPASSEHGYQRTSRLGKKTR